MKQNILVSTLKALQAERKYVWLENAKDNGHTMPRAGYMSKDGKYAWFWSYEMAQKTYWMHRFDFGTVMVHTVGKALWVGDDSAATLRCKQLCQSYDNDRHMANPSPVVCKPGFERANMVAV